MKPFSSARSSVVLAALLSSVMPQSSSGRSARHLARLSLHPLAQHGPRDRRLCRLRHGLWPSGATSAWSPATSYSITPTAIPDDHPYAQFVDVDAILFNPSLAPMPVPGWDLDETLNLTGLKGTFHTGNPTGCSSKAKMVRAGRST